MNAQLPATIRTLRALGAFRRWVVGSARQAQGWKTTTPATFQLAVTSTARFVELHPKLPEAWALGRNARVQIVNAMMGEVLRAKCAGAVWIDCITDDIGAVGEAFLGSMLVSFRINLPKPVAKLKR